MFSVLLFLFVCLDGLGVFWGAGVVLFLTQLHLLDNMDVNQKIFE